MPKVGHTVLASHLGAGGEESTVFLLHDIVRLKGFGEAGPTRSGIEFIKRAVERFARYDVYVDPRLLVVPVLVFEGRLGTGLLSDFELQGGELGFEFLLCIDLEGWGVAGHGLRGFNLPGEYDRPF